VKAVVLIAVLCFLAIVSVRLSPGQAPSNRPIPPNATPTDGRVVGPYASRLSPADIEQIKAAANPAGERLGEINAIGIDKVNVQTGTVATYTRVTLIKHGGKWMVVDKIVTAY
jgi:hypothetical protein